MNVPGGIINGLWKPSLFWLVVNTLVLVYASDYIVWSIGATIGHIILLVWAWRTIVKADDRKWKRYYRNTYGDDAEKMQKSDMEYYEQSMKYKK
jgi:hypothetical protein